MNRDFEFRQLLRAYRKGIISEATFEKEMANLEGGSAEGTSNGGGFCAMGKMYPSERAAITSYLERVRAGESMGAQGFNKWLEVCKTECIRSGLRMIAEREAYHVRVFEARLRDLGVQPATAAANEELSKFVKMLANPDIPDNKKLLKLTTSYDPEELWRPVREFVDLIKDDLESKELIRLYVEDETSSGNWLRMACKALNPDVQEAAAPSRMN
jgi:rubrerythrin